MTIKPELTKDDLATIMQALRLYHSVHNANMQVTVPLGKVLEKLELAAQAAQQEQTAEQEQENTDG